MNSDLDDLTNWFKANRLALNINKSNCMLFQPNGNQNTLGNTLNIGVDPIEHKLYCKFLGIFIDNQLRWNNHLSHISAKLSRSVYILKTVKHILPLTLLRSLYYTMVQPYLTYGIILWGPTYRCHLKQVSILQKKAIRCINKLYYNAHTEPLFIRNKILKLDDLYKFELSKFMFDCINGKLPTPILEFFISNATIHAHHTRQRNVPHVTQTFGTISERAVTHKGPKTWTEIPQTIRLHQNKNIFSRLLKIDYITKYNLMYYLCIELLGTIIVLYECRCRAWVCCVGGGVCRLAGWVCLGETRVFVCLLSVLMSCVRSSSGWVRPAFSL